MNAARLRYCLRALLLVALACAGGCRWAREVTWDLSARDNEPRDQWAAPTNRGPEDDDIREVKAQRAQNEAAFLTRNPGAKLGGSR